MVFQRFTSTFIVISVIFIWCCISHSDAFAQSMVWCNCESENDGCSGEGVEYVVIPISKNLCHWNSGVYMMTSSNGSIFRVTGPLCGGNSPVAGEFPAQRPVTWSFDVFFDLRLNKQLSKHSWGWWFEMPSRPLLRHSNVSTLSSLAAPELS